MSVSAVVIKDLAAKAANALGKKTEQTVVAEVGHVVADRTAKEVLGRDAAAISKSAMLARTGGKAEVAVERGVDAKVVAKVEAAVATGEKEIAAKLALLDKFTERQAQLDQFRLIARMASDGPSHDLVARKASSYAGYYEKQGVTSWAEAFNKENNDALGRWVSQLTEAPALREIQISLGLLDRMSGRQPQLDLFRKVAGAARGGAALDEVAAKATTYAAWYDKEGATSWADAFKGENDKALAGLIGNMTAGHPASHRIEAALAALDRFGERQPQLDQMRRIAECAQGEKSLTAVATKAKNYADFYRGEGATSWQEAYQKVHDNALARIIAG